MGKESSVGQKGPTICRMKKRDRDGDLSEHKPLEGRHGDQSRGDCYVGDGQRNSGNCGAVNSKGPSGRVKV